MAYQTVWFSTDLPEDVIDIVERDLKDNFNNKLEDSKVGKDTTNKDIRNSQNTWIRSDHWISGFLWHYIMRGNRENFLYDVNNIDGEALQYTRYGVGSYYGWHTDQSIATYYKPEAIPKKTVDADNKQSTEDFINKGIELVRKLSFTLQLSHHDDYEGGNVQFMNEMGKSYFAPRKRGTMIIFDSRLNHRVCKVTKGVRKSIVGWCVGPRWR